jgi:hypothetical protein
LASSSLFTLLEFYDLWLQHLSPHSPTLVVIFIHFCEMFFCVWLSVHLFQLFHVLQSSERSLTDLDAYCFLLWAKGPVTYITSLTPGKWDRWRED